MNKIIVTGAAGFVGSAVVNKCLDRGIIVYGIDVIDNPQRLPLKNKNFVYIKKDLTDFNSLFDLLNDKDFDTFYHFAWKGSAGPLREDYECQVQNAILSVDLLKFAKKIGCKKFVFAGSIAEFESQQSVYDDSIVPPLSSIYGVGKSLAHELCKPVANNIGIDLVWAYISNTYGVGENSPRLINNTIKKCLNNEELKFSPGKQYYDFIYIDDVAEAFYLLGEKGKANKSYLIGSGNARPLKEFLLELIEICNSSAKADFGSFPFNGVMLDKKVFDIISWF